MVNPSEYLQWYYLIYLLPGGIALVLLLLSAVGGGLHHHHVGIGHGHSGQGHHGGGHHAHAAPGHAAHSGHQTHSQSQTHSQNQIHGAGSTERVPSRLTFFGFGRVPAPLVWGSALLGWGLFGFWATTLWESQLHLPIVFFLPALAMALAGAMVTEKVTVEAAARLLPPDESYATGTIDLCGLTGTVVFPTDAAHGRVHVYDAHGTLHDVSARSAPGQGQIARGRKVLVTDYDAVKDQVVVEEAPG